MVKGLNQEHLCINYGYDNSMESGLGKAESEAGQTRGKGEKSGNRCTRTNNKNKIKKIKEDLM